MKTIWAFLAALLLLTTAAAARAGDVGFTEIRITNGADKPLVVGIWYPTSGAPAPTHLQTFTQDVAPGGPVAGGHLPLIVMSHGNGGWYGEHYDTSMALAHAGFIVAAVSHTGDTYDDQSRATRMVDRPAAIHRLIDFMTGEWADRGRIDPMRIGAFGFSSGGFTTLVAIGGNPDFRLIPAHCQAHPDYYDCGVLKAHPQSGDAIITAAPTMVWTHDARIRAAVVAAPALGFTFGREGLKDIHIPVQLWRAENDHILPHPLYAEAVRVALPSPPEFHLAPGADHFDFLAPCDTQLAKIAPIICRSAPGFDRTAFHATFDAEVVKFFKRTLG
jgi:predicted dienelactone hydrolase